MSGSADLHQGIVRVWTQANLDTLFKGYWKPSNTTEFLSLLDQEGIPAQPFPFCIFIHDPGNTVTRMSSSGVGSARNENREIPIEFHVHAKAVTNGVSAKQLASSLADSVMQVFGGHPVITPYTPLLTNGGVIQSQYQDDNGIREDNQVWRWVVRYKFLVDVPVAA